MDDDRELRKKRWIVTGNNALNGLSEKSAKQIVEILKGNGKNVECSTEYEYRDICGFRGTVSTDYIEVNPGDDEEELKRS